VIGNWESWRRFYNGILRILRKWLTRRSERGRMSWRRFQTLVQYHALERPRITEVRRRQLEARDVLSAEARTTEEPGAGKPHAGIRAGVVG
jgi:hypothetical protein